MHMSRVEERPATIEEQAEPSESQSTFLEPTQKLSDVKSLALFPD